MPNVRKRSKALTAGVMVVAALAALVTALSGSSGAATQPQAQVQRVYGGVSECEASSSGYGRCPYQLPNGTAVMLPQAPSAVVVTLYSPNGGRPDLPYQLSTDSYTTTTFRFRALTQKGAIFVFNLRVAWVATVFAAQ